MNEAPHFTDIILHINSADEKGMFKFLLIHEISFLYIPVQHQQ